MEMDTIGCLTLDLGIASRALEGGWESGDRHVACPFPGGLLLGVLDGLGHGPEASESARIASATLERHARESVASLFLRCHERLRFARGAVMSLASIRTDARKMTWAGVGNVDAILIRAHPANGRRHEFLMLRAGIVGMRIPILEPASLPLAAGDALLMVTDGIGKDIGELLDQNLPAQQMAEQILDCHRTGIDDALVMVARCREEAP